MPTVPFTTRLDTNLKKQLEQIAQYEDRSASYMANKAIQAMIEERAQTRQLIDTGLALVETGVSLSSDTVNTWFQTGHDTPFPKADTFTKTSS